jgi:hypothetical protein
MKPLCIRISGASHSLRCPIRKQGGCEHVLAPRSNFWILISEMMADVLCGVRDLSALQARIAAQLEL